MALLGGPIILFEFEGVGEVERVIHSGMKWFNGKVCSWSGGTLRLGVTRRVGMKVKFW